MLAALQPSRSIGIASWIWNMTPRLRLPLHKRLLRLREHYNKFYPALSN